MRRGGRLKREGDELFGVRGIRTKILSGKAKNKGGGVGGHKKKVKEKKGGRNKKEGGWEISQKRK